MTKDKTVPDSYKLGRKCRPDDLDNARPGDNQPNYPTTNPQYGYNYETPTHKILVMFQDGHHGPDRWNLSENDVGTTENPMHIHDDWKRSPPTILDQDPTTSQIGFLATHRVPEAMGELAVPGDKLGLSPNERARMKTR